MIKFTKKKKFTSNNDLDNLLSCLSSDYKIELICRKSLIKFDYSIKENFNFCKVQDIKEKNINIFMISITPFNFSLLKLVLLRKNKRFCLFKE